jgi:hypothetical protein
MRSSSFHRRSAGTLILVCALLALLALLGVTLLSSTQTERYAANQNSVNTQADLLIQGLVNITASVIPQELYGVDWRGRRLRPASQEMPGGVPTGYVPYVSPATTLMLAARTPVISSNNNQVSWGAVSWPLIPDGSNQYAFVSPYGESTLLYSSVNKALLEFQPVYRTIAGQLQPALLVYLPSSNVARFVPRLPASTAGYYLTPHGPVDAAALGALTPDSYDQLATMAASAAGDGIADAGLWPLPCGPLNGITYYASLRIVDRNSAINVSTAYRGDHDLTATGTPSPIYGYFRSNTGLREMLAQSTADQELQTLNTIRFGPSAIASLTAYDDLGNPRPDFHFSTQGDAIDSQLARRITAPGTNAPDQFYASFGLSDCIALASRFSLLRNGISPSLLEKTLSNELLTFPEARNAPYSPAQIHQWYSTLFDPAPTFSPVRATPLRASLTTSNPVSNATASRFGNGSTPPTWSSTANYNFGDWVIGPDQRSYVCLVPNTNSWPVMPTYNKTEYWAQMPWTTTPVKASANTATFEQLYLAYCHVMTDSQTLATVTSVSQWLPPMRGSAGSPEPQMSMFRSVIRDNRSWPVTPASTARVQLTPMQMMQLRAAIAAVNTLQLRNNPAVAGPRYTVSRHITLCDTLGRPAYDAEIFGTDTQPYILGMYAHVSRDKLSRFLAVQLVNPFPVPIEVTSSWSFATVDRTQMPAMTVTPVSTTTPTFTIPAAIGNHPGTVLLEDGPAPAGFAQPANCQRVPGLATAIGQELVILKPRRFDGTPSQTGTSTTSGEAFDEIDNPCDLVPVDQIDMTGTDAVASGTDLYYRRAADGTLSTASGSNYGWNFTWPGRYNAYSKHNPVGPKNAPVYVPAFSGQYSFAQPIVIGPPPQNTGTVNPDFTRLPGGAFDATARTPLAPTYPTITLRLDSPSMPSPHAIAATDNQFPFGGFARNGDLLQVPFIGAYRITPCGQSPLTGFVELNSVTMDSALADDQTLPLGGSKLSSQTATDALTDPFSQQLGRFCPVGNSLSSTLDFGTDPTRWHYHWTRKLFDYVTVQAPHDDYCPNVDPTFQDESVRPPIPSRYQPSAPVTPIANSIHATPNDTLGGHSEDTTGVEGLININTAGWKVLSMIPWVPRGTDHISDTGGSADGVDDNINLARAIVAYRNTHGPFGSIVDLYSVPVFRLENDRLLTANDQNVKLLNVSSDGVRYDFADRFLLLNRVSNLITTRSDTFTCYLLLQGWRNAGSSAATLAVERRAAFVADRNGVTPVHPQATLCKIPTD